MAESTIKKMNEVIYSENEHIIGKWIDGSILYEKTVECGALPSSGQIGVAHGISNLNMIVSMQGITSTADNSSTIPIPLGQTNLGVYMYMNKTTVYVAVESNRSTYTRTYITIRYTKTS